MMQRYVKPNKNAALWAGVRYLSGMVGRYLVAFLFQCGLLSPLIKPIIQANKHGVNYR